MLKKLIKNALILSTGALIISSCSKETDLYNPYASLEDYSKNWEEYYDNRDFEGMQKEYKKMQEKLKEIVPIEEVIISFQPSEFKPH